MTKLFVGTLKQLHEIYRSRTSAPIFSQVTKSRECTYPKKTVILQLNISLIKKTRRKTITGSRRKLLQNTIAKSGVYVPSFLKQGVSFSRRPTCQDSRAAPQIDTTHIRTFFDDQFGGKQQSALSPS